MRAILRLINYAFVDTVDQNPITRISRLRHYDSISEGVDINKTTLTKDNNLLKKVMEFMRTQIDKFESFQATDDK